MDPTYSVAVLLLMLAGIGLAGLRAMRGSRGKSSEEYFFGGRVLDWRGLAASLFVTLLWCGVCVGVLGGFSIDRAAWSLLAVSLAGGLLLLGFFAGPLFVSRGSRTLAELLGGGDSDTATRAVVSSGLITLTVLIRIPLTIVIGVRLMHAVFGWDFMTSALLLIVVPGLFIVAGGFSSMVAVQEAAAIVAVIGLGVGALAGPTGFALHVDGAADIHDVHWTALVAGTLMLGLWLTCVDQGIMQKAIATRGPDQIRRGGIAAAAAILAGAGIVFLGMFAREPVAAGTPLQQFMTPMVGAGIVAAAIAGLSAHFVSAATLATFDLPWFMRNSSDDAARVLMGRLATTVVVLLSIVVAAFLLVLGNAVIVWLLALYAVLAGPMAGVAVVRFLWPRVHGRAIMSTLLLMWILGLTFLVVRPSVMTSMNGLIGSVFMTSAVSAVVLLGATRVVSSGVPPVTMTFEKRVGTPKL